MPDEIAAAVRWAEAVDAFHVIVVEGAGRAFCAGFDLQEYAEDRPADGSDHPDRREKTPWEPMVAGTSVRRCIGRIGTRRRRMQRRRAAEAWRPGKRCNAADGAFSCELSGAMA